MPQLRGAHYPHAEEVDLFIKTRWIKLPRLIRLVRQLSQDVGDKAVLIEAITLADDLFLPTLDDWLAECFERGLIKFFAEPDTLPPQPVHLPTAIQYTQLEFSSCRLFLRYVAYHDLRVVVSGCIQMLNEVCCHSLGQPPPFDSLTAEQVDQYSALQVASCAAYVLDDPSVMRLRQLQYNWPLAYSYSAWSRIEERIMAKADFRTIEDIQLASTATEMMYWIVDHVNKPGFNLAGQEVTKKGVYWHFSTEGQWNEPRLRWLSGVLSGGMLG